MPSIAATPKSYESFFTGKATSTLVSSLLISYVVRRQGAAHLSATFEVTAFFAVFNLSVVASVFEVRDGGMVGSDSMRWDVLKCEV